MTLGDILVAIRSLIIDLPCFLVYGVLSEFMESAGLLFGGLIYATIVGITIIAMLLGIVYAYSKVLEFLL